MGTLIAANRTLMIPGQGYLASNRLYSQLMRLPKDVGYKKALLPVRVVDDGQEGQPKAKSTSRNAPTSRGNPRKMTQP